METASVEDVFSVASETDRFWCAREAMTFARNLGFGENAQWELAIVVAELVSNAVRYGGSGVLTLRQSTGPRAGIEIVVTDPGSRPTAAAAPRFARRHGPSTGLGIGLRTVRLLCHEVSIDQDLQGGVVVTAARYLGS